MGSRARPVSYDLHAPNHYHLARCRSLILSQYIPSIWKIARVQAQRLAERPGLRYSCFSQASLRSTLNEAAAPTFKSAQAAEYYRHHDHPHSGEDVHEAKKTCPVQYCEPVACKSVNITDQDAVKHVSSYSKVPSTPSPTSGVHQLSNKRLAPALAVIEYYDADFDYDFSDTNKYRGPPTEEREKAWQELYYRRFTLNSASDQKYLLLNAGV